MLVENGLDSNCVIVLTCVLVNMHVCVLDHCAASSCQTCSLCEF